MLKQGEIEDFEDFVDSFSSQMNDILTGKIKKESLPVDDATATKYKDYSSNYSKWANVNEELELKEKKEINETKGVSKSERRTSILEKVERYDVYKRSIGLFYGFKIV